MTDMPAFPFPRTALDPPEQYEEMRAGCPFAKAKMWDGSWAWLITRHADVKHALMNSGFSATAKRADFPKLSPTKDALYAHEPPTFLRMDGSEHGRFRSMLAREFALRSINAIRPDIQRIVDKLIDGMLEQGPPIDFATSFANALPSQVISKILGIPYEDHEFFEERTAARLDIRKTPEEAVAAGADMLAYLDRLLREKEKDPQDGADLLGRLVIEQIRPGHLTHDEAVAMAELLLRAGHETTSTQLTLGLLTLFVNPDQLELLRNDLSLVHSAVEEILRHGTIAQFISARVAKEDVEVNGHVIREGEGIYALLSSANRDEAAFPEADTFDVRRKKIPHVAFGFGPHGCLGQLLARAELQIALERLLVRLPGLRLHTPFEEIAFKTDFFIYGPDRLVVSW